MGKVVLDISMSLDGYVAGPNQTLEQGLGEGGERLHEWAIAVAAWRESHNLSGGEKNVDNDVMAETLQRIGATVMGRRMFSGGEGPWESDPNADAWWGDEPPFHHPVFILTHHARDPMTKQGGRRRAAVRRSPQRRPGRARSHQSRGVSNRRDSP